MGLKKLAWHEEKRKLSDLIPWEDNPRRIPQAQALRLIESFDIFGQVETMAIGPKDELYNGHQRLGVLMSAYGGDYEVDVRVSNRALTENEKKKLTIYLHVGTVGEMDMFKLTESFDFTDLVEWGYDKEKLGIDPNEVDYDELWKGMPEFDQEDQGAVRTIAVHFATKEDVRKFAKLVGQKITNKTKSINYPKQDRMNLKAYQVTDEP